MSKVTPDASIWAKQPVLKFGMNRSMPQRASPRAQAVAATALLAIGGPSPHKRRWGRQIIGHALRVANRCVDRNEPERGRLLLELVVKAAPSLATAKMRLARAALATDDLYDVRKAVEAIDVRELRRAVPSVGLP